MAARYSVLNRSFPDYAAALVYARQRAGMTGERVALMEKLDALTPWHVLQWIGGND